MEDRFIPTRKSLLSRLKNWDDEESWRDFFETYGRLIYRVAIKGGLDDAEAQDAVQETVITVAKKIKEFEYDPRVGSFKGWLLTITYWRIADQKRKRRGQAQSAARADNEPATALVESVPDPGTNELEAVWEEEWKQNLIYAAAQRVKRQVKAKQYQAFDFYVVKKLPVKEVSRKLGLPASRVYYAGYRVGAMMKRELRRLQQQRY